MLIDSLSIRNVRSIEWLQIGLGDGITVVHGPNGIGKTSVIESIFYALTGRSCRTKNVREIIRSGASNFRVEINIKYNGNKKIIEAALDRSMNKVHLLDGNKINSFTNGFNVPHVAAFVPDKMEIVKGAPGVRRIHIDSFASVLNGLYIGVRSRYVKVLAQRNALISRGVKKNEINAWDKQLAKTAFDLTNMRRDAVLAIKRPYKKYAGKLGLFGDNDIEYKPSIRHHSQKEFEIHFKENVEHDLERGFTNTGPHRDDIGFKYAGRDIRKYGSQGEQRTALLALLLAEKEVVMDEHGKDYILLLDDVLSDLDRNKRGLLLKELEKGGQSMITTVDIDEIPGNTMFSTYSFCR